MQARAGTAASPPIAGSRRALILGGLAAALLPLGALRTAAAAAAPPLMLAGVYRRGMPLDDYWVSEKYDGVRAYWDGRQLRTRGGETIVAPAWFTAPLPATPMDGELWAGRGRFELSVSTVRSQTPTDAAWREMRFMVFDLPAQPGDFTARLAVLRRLLPITGATWIVPVPQQRATTHEALQALLDKTVKMGGEGLILHRGASPYRAERTVDLLKVKPFDDAEARVVSYVEGRGRHAGRMGALWVETPTGQRFKLGTGFSDAERNRPPPIGSWVTYRYQGTTAKGLPRFASFMRVREDG
ncbi:DNA ligase [Variovorax sp. J22P168]|uniref:DNA ligase n=1 Tax=Variovorax jilinensis TaxID=3053513 RepID=UPI002576DDC4|nr:DNA ligase [Variovorax sp. J22P168]MDM0013349.1 DNA ligase [Variovorax sp. J22P168]